MEITKNKIILLSLNWLFLLNYIRRYSRHEDTR